MRILLMDHRTGDYNVFLAPWVEHFRAGGGFRALDDIVGNYNLPYQYFLALFSYIPMAPLYLIKDLSIIFDVILAWGAGRIALHYTRSKNRQLAAFLAVMLWPTVVLNGACWGQCDSIFSAFCVLAFYAIAQKRPQLSLVWAALALAFKVQAVFFLPLYAVLLLTGEVKPRQLWVFPAVYLATLLPGVLLGHPLKDALLLYTRQVGGAGNALNYNSASVFAFLPRDFDAALYPVAENAGIAATLGLIYACLLWVHARKKSLAEKTRLGFAVLLVLGIPFLLPHMHDRYFFLADVFTLILACIRPEFLPCALLCLFGSLLGYHAYLMGRFLLPMSFGAVGIALAMGITVLFIHKSFHKPEIEL
jgi:Gpi18-like mannosyltransferase